MKHITALVVLCAAGLTLFFPGLASADVNDFTINNFEADYVLNNNAVGGSLQTTEKITVTFSDNNHGIFRYVPKSYNNYSTKLTIGSVARDGSPESYTTSSSNDNLVLKIGDADKTITGKHVYELRYYQERVVNFTGETPEFYWDVNGEGWSQLFEKVTATLRMQNGSLDQANVACYAGVRGSSGKACAFSKENNAVIFSTTKPLGPSEGLTIAASLPAGMFTAPTVRDKLKDNTANIIGILFGLITAIVALVVWFRYGKDYTSRGIIVPEYGPPGGLSPAEVGMLADFRVDAKDLSATLIDLAVRKFVRLHEEEKKVLLWKSKEYSVELLNNNFDTLKTHEKKLLEGIFGGKTEVGTLIPLKKLNKTTMQSSVQGARTSIKNDLIKKYGLIESKYPKIFVFLVFMVIALVGMAFLLKSGGFIAGAIIGGVAVLLAGIFMQRRSHGGVETYQKIMGLKLYMNVAEKERLKMMQSVDRPYTEPKKTVELFEKLLPYAVALGVEKSWAKQFDGIMTENPDWMASNSAAAFSSAHLASSITAATSSFSTSFATSSGTGSSGGGSSGGGGGGGGGGGW